MTQFDARKWERVHDLWEAIEALKEWMPERPLHYPVGLPDLLPYHMIPGGSPTEPKRRWLESKSTFEGRMLLYRQRVACETKSKAAYEETRERWLRADEAKEERHTEALKAWEEETFESRAESARLTAVRDSLLESMLGKQSAP